MLRDEKNIDHLFQQGLAGYEPPMPSASYVWDKVAGDLDYRKGKKRRLIIWSVAASLALLLSFGAGYLFNLQYDKQPIANEKVPRPAEDKQPDGQRLINILEEQQSEQNQIANNDKPVKNTDETISSKPENPAQNNNNNQIASAPVSPANNNQTTDNQSKNTGNDTNATLFTASNTNNTTVAAANATNEDEAPVLKPVMATTIGDVEAMILQTTKADPIKVEMPEISVTSNNELIAFEQANTTTSENAWKIGGQFSPLYSFRSTEQSSDVKLPGTEYYNTIENPMMTYSGGISVEFSSQSRWSIQSGILYSQVGQVSSEFIAVTDMNSPYTVSTSVGEIQPNIALKPDLPPGISAPPGGPIFSEEDLIQQFEYIEIPFIARYKVIDRKIDFNVMGGLSTNFLVANDVYLNSVDKSNRVGKTDGVNAINYSSTIGLGAEYEINKNMSVQLEPAFRYSLTPINSDQNVKVYPYSFAIFTGIFYSF